MSWAEGKGLLSPSCVEIEQLSTCKVLKPSSWALDYLRVISICDAIASSSANIMEVFILGSRNRYTSTQL